MRSKTDKDIDLLRGAAQIYQIPLLVFTDAHQSLMNAGIADKYQAVEVAIDLYKEGEKEGFEQRVKAYCELLETRRTDSE